MIDYQKQIDNAYLTLKSAYDNETLRPGVKYEIYTAQANDKVFRMAHHASTDIDNFKKNAKNVITNFGSDVIQILIWVGKKKDTINIKITDTYIELVDEKQPICERESEHRAEPVMQGLGAIEELRNSINEQKFTNEIRFLKQDYEFQIERLKDQVNELMLENQDLVEDNEVLNDTLDGIQTELENTPEEDGSGEKMKILGMIAGIGKIMGLKNDEIAELGAIISGTDNASVGEKEQVKDNAGGLSDENTGSPESNEHLSDTDKIKVGLVKWINALNADMVQPIAWMLNAISVDVARTGNAELINKILDFIDDNTPEDTDGNENKDNANK